MNIQRWSFRILLLFAASIPLEDSISFGVGRISKVLGLLALAVWILAVAATGTLRRPTPAVWLATAFVGWSLLSYFWSSTPSATLTKVTTLAQLLAVVWLVWDQVTSQRDLVALMRAFLVGSFAASGLTLVAAASGRATEGARFASNNAGPNNTGCLLAVAVAMAFLLVRTDPDRRYKALYVAFMPVAVVAIILTASRTAMISVVIGLAIVGLDRRKFTARRLIGLVPLGLIAFALAVFLVPQKALDRLGTTSSEISSGTLDGRTLYWKLCLRLFTDHPFQGVGSGAFPNENLLLGGRGIVAHNAFLSILAELGAVGLALFVGMIGLAAWGLVGQPRDARRAWLAMGVAWLIGASALTWEVRKITWFLLAIALVQARVGYQARTGARVLPPADLAPDLPPRSRITIDQT
jgi:O-antigen ligase